MRKQAFTLVELIVVITILAVLGTIAFVSFQGYAVQARDSARISDLTTMKKALEFYKVKSDFYPTPSETSFDVSYSGALVWKQGQFGESVLQEIKSMSEVPTDPLTNTPYTFSRLNTRGEFQLGAFLEGGVAFNIGDSTYANGAKQAEAYVVGTYNGRVAKAQSGATTYILAVPSIINGETQLDYQVIANSNTLVYKGGNNLPSNYESTDYNSVAGSGNTLISGNVLLFQTNDISTLTDNSPAGQTARQGFMTNLQAAYTGTTLASSSSIAPILTGIDRYEIVTTTVNNLLGTDLETSGVSGGTICGLGQHTEDGVSCVSNIRSCAIILGAGEQHWNTASSTWGSCGAISCDSNYHISGNSCISDTQSCSIINGTGQQTWNLGSGSWNNCTVLSCNSTYHESANTCISNTQTCSVTNGTGQQTWNGSAWGTCSVVSCNSGYGISGSSCVSSPTWTTGAWTGSSGDCSPDNWSGYRTVTCPAGSTIVTTQLYRQSRWKTSHGWSGSSGWRPNNSSYNARTTINCDSDSCTYRTKGLTTQTSWSNNSCSSSRWYNRLLMRLDCKY